MPIVESKGSVHFEYEIPESIKCIITEDFLEELRNQLFKICEYLGLDTPAEDFFMYTSTFGWETAFGKACLLTNNTELLNYSETLPWYDSDMFNDELVEMLFDRHFIPRNS